MIKMSPGFSALLKFRRSFMILAFITAFTSLIIACTDNSSSASSTKGDSAQANSESSKDANHTDLVKRGEYLVTIMGCDDCHSPKKMGPRGPEIIAELRFGGFPSGAKLPKIDTNVVGKPWVVMAPDLTTAFGPWGQSFSANISSDSTGIGNWKEEQFFKAVREGKLKGLDGTRPLLPPMPWPNYTTLKDEDARAIFAYLKASKPVQNIVPAPKPPGQLN